MTTAEVKQGLQDRKGSVAPVRVSIVQDSQATGEVAELYAVLRVQFFGFVPDVFKLVSTRPDMLRTLVDTYSDMFGGGHLSRDVKEIVALTVARVASCQFCTAAHDTLLRVVGTEGRIADAVLEGKLDDEAVPAEVRALADLASDITQHAYRITDERFRAVLDNGWSEEQVLEAVWVACVFNAIVRLADTLGLYQLGQLTEQTPAGAGEAS
jgi:uncharacterized peroxidase-related enzyme